MYYLPVKNKNISIRKNNLNIIQFSLNDSIKLYNYMYKESTIHLERKYKIFEEYNNLYTKKEVQRLQ